MTKKQKQRCDDLYRVRRYIGDECGRWLIGNGFLDAPASSRYHGSYDGGLFDHSFAVLRCLLKLTKREKLQWKRTASPYIVAILHDVCKIDQYEKITREDGTIAYHYAKTEIEGHGAKSVTYAKWLIPELTDEEEACIRWHMGAFGDSEEQKGYSEAVQKFQNVLWTHTADMIASPIEKV